MRWIRQTVRAASRNRKLREKREPHTGFLPDIEQMEPRLCLGALTSAPAGDWSAGTPASEPLPALESTTDVLAPDLSLNLPETEPFIPPASDPSRDQTPAAQSAAIQQESRSDAQSGQGASLFQVQIPGSSVGASLLSFDLLSTSTQGNSAAVAADTGDVVSPTSASEADGNASGIASSNASPMPAEADVGASATDDATEGESQGSISPDTLAS